MKHAVRPIELLLVESDPAEVVVVKEAFLTAKIINNVRVVEDGEKALDYLHRRGTFSQVLRPDLLLLNWSLPHMSGNDLLSAVRAEPEFASLPVAVISGGEDQRDVERAQALEANWFITRPIDDQHLMDIVRSSADLWFCIVTVPDAVIVHKRRARATHSDDGRPH